MNANAGRSPSSRAEVRRGSGAASTVRSAVWTSRLSALGLRRRLALAVGIPVLLVVLAGPAAAEPAGHAEEECIALLEDGNPIDRCQEAPNPILPETNEIIWGSIAFLIILAGLWKFGLPAVRSAMEQRAERIRTSLDEAEKAKTDAEEAKADYQRQLADARGEAARIIEEARQQADAVRRDLTQRAEAEAQELRQRNAEQLEAERARVLGELRGQVAVLAVEAAERVVRANLDSEANRRLVEDYIRNLGTVGAEGGRG